MGSAPRKFWRGALIRRNVLACDRGGRLKFVELVTDSDRAREVLEMLGLPSAPPAATTSTGLVKATANAGCCSAAHVRHC